VSAVWLKNSSWIALLLLQMAPSYSIVALEGTPYLLPLLWACRGQLEEYMDLLVQGFNPGAAEGLMCRDTVSVGWDGRLYDCDFNQQLALGLGGPNPPQTVFDISSLEELEGRPIAVASHCFGCTAGSGSSCQGATA